MKFRLISLCYIVILLITFCAFSLSQNSYPSDWLQFRGNERNGISKEIEILKKWPENGPELLWKKNIGEGFSEVLVSGEICFTTSGEKIDSISGTEYLIAFNISNGDEVWKAELDSIFIDVDNWGDGARSTPAIDENNIYCFSSYGKLTALAKKDGKELWKVDFVKEFGSTVPRWGFSTSPLLIDDILVIEVGGTESKTFAAFNKENGQVIWTKGNGGSTYCSPIMANINDTEQIIFINNSKLYSFNTKGDTLWTYQVSLRGVTAVPVFIEPNMIFLSVVSRSIGSLLIKVEDNIPSEVFSGNTLQNHWSSSSYHDGFIYGFNVAALQCISIETGERKWTKRGFGKGSLIVVGNKLLVLSDKGKLMLVEANHEVFTEINSFQALEGKSWTAPSFANGCIYLRNLTEIACYKLK